MTDASSLSFTTSNIFDAYLIGLTATPSNQTFGFFHQNLVQEYSHERAVADGVNVNYDVYQIRTEIGARGSQVEKGFYIDKRNRQTRKIRWMQLDEVLSYVPSELDRAVVAPDQIRTVIKTFRNQLFSEIFPGRTTVPKTLIFAKDDSHAEDIVKIVREEFGKGNDFCQKITYRTTGASPKDLIQKFRNSYDPRIAVTVDMIATGTDIKPLEIVMFMRSVKSRGFFEQMKGRGVRVISDTEFQQVTPDAKTKTHFVIVDAVGVCERDKSDSRPLEQKKSVPLDKLLEGIALGVREPDALSSLAGRLIRLEKRLDPELQAEVEKLAGGKKLSQIAQNLLDAIDPDYIEAKAKEGKSETYEPSEEELRNLRGSIANFAVAPIATDPGLRQKLIELQSAAEQTIDIISKDKLIFAGADARTAESARDTVRSFREYIEKHKAEIETLQILYSRPFHKRLTEETLRDFEAKLKPEFGPTPVESLWMAFEKSGSASSPSAPRSQTRRFTDLVSLVRVALEQEPVLQPFEEHVRSRFDEWIEMKRRDTRSLPQRWADANPDLVVGSRELVMNLTAQSLKDEFLGRVCLTEHGEKCLLNQRLARLTPVLVPPEYVLYLLKSWRFRRFVDGLNTGSLIQHMFTSQLARFTFPLPPISEQQRIIAEVDCRLSVIEELEAVVAANLKRAERLRQSILHSAFSGSLDP